jgi:uncharacterized RDD family membrane protein YckC
MAQSSDGSPDPRRSADDVGGDDPTVAWQKTDLPEVSATPDPVANGPATPEPAAADPAASDPATPSNPLISWAPSGDARRGADLAGGTADPAVPRDQPASATNAAAVVPDDRRVVPVAGYVVAGTPSRVVAYFVDGLLLLLINIIITRIVDPSAYDIGQAAAPATVSPTILLFTRAIAIGIEYAYFVGFWTSRGRATLGMRLLRITVIAAAGDRPLRLVPASARWLLLSGAIGLVGLFPVATDFFGLVSLIWVVVLFISVVANPLGQGIHDQAAGSLVVQRVGVGSNALLVGCLVLMALFIVLPVLSLILVGGQIEQILLDIGQSI